MGSTHSQPVDDGRARLFWGVCAVAGAAALFYLTSSSSSSSSSSSRCSDEEIIALLREITKEFHRVFAEAAQMTSNLLSSLDAKGKGRGSPRSIRETMEAMSLQRMLLARLEGAEAAVLSAKGVPSAVFDSRCSQLAETNEEVQKLVIGLRQMYEDAMQGTLPLLPGLEVPVELTQERVLQILNKIQRRKEEKFRQILVATTERELSPEGATAAVTAQLQESNTEAERSVLQEEQLLLQHERQQQQQQQQQKQQPVELTPMVFLQAIATHCRDPVFKAKKAAVDQSHSEHIFDLLRRGRTPQQAEPSSWSELALRLESCESMDAFVLCLVAPATASSSSSSSSSGSSSSSSSSKEVCAPLSLLGEISNFLEDAESEKWALDQLTPICLDTADMPHDAEEYAPLREAVAQHGHCFALYKGQTLKSTASRNCCRRPLAATAAAAAPAAATAAPAAAIAAAAIAAAATAAAATAAAAAPAAATAAAATAAAATAANRPLMQGAMQALAQQQQPQEAAAAAAATTEATTPVEETAAAAAETEAPSSKTKAAAAAAAAAAADADAVETAPATAADAP
ncbi:hypothetical protein, conserved [Eimeria brunetti]|uniref:Uncharacterized protein n=1 Tax=Eimeria brunetti TaxID=51314 RepID=U6LCV3_9EIME|nr:hypothetical protein, conserved [Eimeria brunetti]